MLFTTNHLVDYTFWTLDGAENDGYEKSFDSFYDDELNNLYLQFEINWDDDINNEAYWTDEDASATRCLVCMNVDENSELRNGDKGFAACYKPFEGSFWETTDNWSTASITTEASWEFLGEVKAINGGEAVKATGKNGWLESFTWNKNEKLYQKYCWDDD